MPQSQLRVGIAGYGIVGKRRRQFIDSNPALRTVAVCDRVFDGNGTLDDGTPYFASYRDLLEQPLDMLFVCLTNDVAADATIGGLQRGLHVFCEKPPGREIADVVRVRACEAAHPTLKLKYGFNHRYHDSVRDAIKLIESNRLGRILNLRGIYGKSAIINFQSDWRTRREIAGGGILLDQGIHMVDLLRLFGGEFDEIHSFIANDYWRHDVEDNAYAIMRTPSGVVAMLHSSATQWRHRFSLDMTLENGAIVLSGILSGSKSYGAETMTVAYKSDGDAGDPREETTRYHNDPSWADEINEFADCVLNDREVVSGSSLEALKTMELVYRIYCADPEWKARFDLTDKMAAPAPQMGANQR